MGRRYGIAGAAVPVLEPRTQKSQAWRATEETQLAAEMIPRKLMPAKKTRAFDFRKCDG